MRSCARSLALLAFLSAGCSRGLVVHPAPPLPAFQAADEASPAVAVLEQGASSLDLEVRSRALAGLLRWSPEPGGGAWALRALYDPSEYVRRAALDALLDRLPEPESLDRLLAYLEREDAGAYGRGHLGLELALRGECERAGPVLRVALDRASGGYGRVPLALAAAACGDEAAAGELREALARGDFPLETGFFRDLARSGVPELGPALARGSAEVEPELVFPVALGLLLLDQREEGEALLRSALESAGRAEQMALLDELWELGGGEARRLSSRWRWRYPALRRYARVLRVVEGRAPLGAARRLARKDDRELRALALRALARAGQERGGRARRVAHDALLAALDDEELSVRLAALRGLQRLGEPADRPRLAAFFTDEDALLRVEAARAWLAAGGTGAAAPGSPSAPSPAGPRG